MRILWAERGSLKKNWNKNNIFTQNPKRQQIFLRHITTKHSMYDLSHIRHIERKRDSWGCRMREWMTKRWWEGCKKINTGKRLQWRNCKGPWLPTSRSKVSMSKRFVKMNKYFVIFLQNVNLYWCLYCREKVTYLERLLSRIYFISVLIPVLAPYVYIRLKIVLIKKISWRKPNIFLSKSVYPHHLLYRLS